MLALFGILYGEKKRSQVADLLQIHLFFSFSATDHSLSGPPARDKARIDPTKCCGKASRIMRVRSFAHISYEKSMIRIVSSLPTISPVVIFVRCGDGGEDSGKVTYPYTYSDWSLLWRVVHASFFVGWKRLLRSMSTADSGSFRRSPCQAENCQFTTHFFFFLDFLILHAPIQGD